MARAASLEIAINRRRRSTISAIAPAGSARSMTGRLSAASTSATIHADDEREVISHPAPTSCIHVPMFDTIVAIHKLRNSALCSGLHGDGTARAAGASSLMLMSQHQVIVSFPPSPLGGSLRTGTRSAAPPR